MRLVRKRWTMRAALARVRRNRIVAGLAHRCLTGHHPILLANAVDAVRLLPSFAQFSRFALVHANVCRLVHLGCHFHPRDGLCGANTNARRCIQLPGKAPPHVETCVLGFMKRRRQNRYASINYRFFNLSRDAMLVLQNVGSFSNSSITIDNTIGVIIQLNAKNG